MCAAMWRISCMSANSIQNSLTDSEIAFRRQLTIEGLWRSTLCSRAHLPISVVVIGRCARQSVNRRVAALRARTAAIYRTKEVPHTLPIFGRSRVIVDHYMSICQTGRPVACPQCDSRTEAHCSASLRAWRFSAAHCSASLRAVRFAHWSAIQRTKEVPQARTARRHDGTTARRHDGKTARRHDGTTARRHDGTTARRNDGTTARRHDGTTARRHDGTTARRHDPQSRGLLKFNNTYEINH